MGDSFTSALDEIAPEPPVTCLACGSHDGVVTITKNDDGTTTWVGHCNTCGNHEEKDAADAARRGIR
jgi:transcription elongation factor Elf1